MKKPLQTAIILSVFLIIATSSFFLVPHLLSKNHQEQQPVEPDITEVELEASAKEITEPIVDNSNPYLAPDCSIGNFTTTWGELMLINPNFTVSADWIANRKTELIDITNTYGIIEGNPGNGTPLLDPTAATHLNDMLIAYQAYNPGHEITTRSCFRSVGTNCGRLCYATGTSDHHTGYTCDLVDDYYGDSLDTDTYANHPDWQWLHENSYKYGFIDRFIEEWAGGTMYEPVNIDANGTTGLYETWHYRYVGITAATEIATGKYNNGNYDSLEHYLKASGRLKSLLSPAENCQ